MAQSTQTTSKATSESTTFTTVSTNPKGLLPPAQASSPASATLATPAKVGNIIGRAAGSSNKWFKEDLGKKVKTNMSGTKDKISKIIDSFSSNGKKYTLVQNQNKYFIQVTDNFDYMMSPSKISKAMPKETALNTFNKLKQTNIKLKF